MGAGVVDHEIGVHTGRAPGDDLLGAAHRLAGEVGKAVEHLSRLPSEEAALLCFRLWAARPPLGMGGDPRLDGRPRPDAPAGQLDLRGRKVFVGFDELRDSLARDAEDLRDLRHTHEVVRHAADVNLTVDGCQGITLDS